MAKERNALKAGSFILISIVLILAIIAGIKGIDKFFHPFEKRTASFTLKDDLGGLRVGDDVRIGGFKVGEVREIEVVPGSDPRLKNPPVTNPADLAGDMLLVTFAMPRKYQVREGARIGIQGTVTGQSNLNFFDLGRGAPYPQDKPLRGKASPFGAVMASLSEMSPKLDDIVTQVRDETVPGLNRTLADVRTQTVPKVNETILGYKAMAETGTAFINELRGYLKPVIEKYHTFADSATKMTNEIGGVFGDTHEDFRTTMKNVSSATGTIDRNLPGVMESVRGVMTKVDTAVTSANVALEDVKKTAENARDMTASAKAVIVGNKSRLDGIITSLKSTSDNLKAASSEIRHSPWRLLYQPKTSELSNLNLYDTARQFAEGANDLNDASQALRDAVKSGQSSDAELNLLIDRVNKSFSHFGDVEKKLWVEVKE